MKYEISQETLKSEFVSDVERRSQQNVRSCYQCGKCSAGCPICFAMDYTPNQIIRMIQIGIRDEVLSSKTIWLCASCETCSTRCPREVDLAAVMDALRRMAQEEKVNMKEKDVPVFNRIFLEIIRRYGRLYEAGLIGNYNLNSGHLLKDVFMAPKMFLKGKISPFPRKTKNIREIRKMFKRVKKVEGR
ncbi:MAG: heterodisulfide reductase subunit C [Nitrospirae bacterium]|nr:heterodisulfide reductase subunit C [Nitrospirota bacterium]